MAARYESLRAVAACLKECSSGVPFPGSLALQSTSTLVLVITTFMELKEVQERKRELAERLLQRAVDISNLIERHQRQLRRDQQSSSFILRFVDTMKVINVFVAAQIPPEEKQTLPRRTWSKLTVVVGSAFKQVGGGQEAAQGFEAHWHSLDSLLLDFQSYLLSSQATMGPHQLIKHPDVQVFWRCRLTNALDARWEYFWDHFLDEYPQLKELFLEEAQEMREIFQSLTRSRNKDVVDPMGLNRVFQPINEPVERIVRTHLQSHLSSNSASKLPAWMLVLCFCVCILCFLAAKLNSNSDLCFTKDRRRSGYSRRSSTVERLLHAIVTQRLAGA
ncbi:hypothetical protein L7F22_037531 [Adiantum nelumboides]|nr:hypothetical protein [Adiantum nelumboides]